MMNSHKYREIVMVIKVSTLGSLKKKKKISDRLVSLVSILGSLQLR